MRIPVRRSLVPVATMVVAHGTPAPRGTLTTGTLAGSAAATPTAGTDPSPSPATDTPSVLLSLETERPSIGAGEPLTVTVAATNTGTGPIDLACPAPLVTWLDLTRAFPPAIPERTSSRP